MLFIFSLIIASIFALTAKSTIKRHPYPWYIGALALTLFISLFPFSRNLPEAVTFLLDLFRRGALSCALWCIVMWTGAFSNGSWLIKRLIPVRGELSIFAAMLTLGHNIGYGRTYFVRFFTNASALPANQFAACIITIILLIIMILLTILSFPKIRKRMKAKKWKQIKRFAYLFYALLYLHIMLLCQRWQGWLLFFCNYLHSNFPWICNLSNTQMVFLKEKARTPPRIYIHLLWRISCCYGYYLCCFKPK